MKTEIRKEMLSQLKHERDLLKKTMAKYEEQIKFELDFYRDRSKKFKNALKCRKCRIEDNYICEKHQDVVSQIIFYLKEKREKLIDG